MPDTLPARPRGSAARERAVDELVAQLRLDHLAHQVSEALSRSGIPHALIKGPTTSLWLYDPPRPYKDVDLLVPASRLQDAARCLAGAGIVAAGSARPGEEAPHSLVLRTDRGAEVDLHFGLPSVPAAGDGDALWDALASHVEAFELSGRTLPALGPTARGLVLAVHAVNSGRRSERPLEDLRRARAALGAAGWTDVVTLARTIGVEDHLRVAEMLAQGHDTSSTRADVLLYVNGASGSAIQLERLLNLSVGRAARDLFSELFPSREMVSRMFPDLASRRAPYLRGCLRRWALLGRGLPRAVREVHAARRRSREA